MPAPERRKPSGAPNRIVRSSANRRLARTIVLGAIVVFLAILWLADQLGLDRDELLGYALTSVMLVGAVVVFAVAGAVLLRLLKRLFR